MRTHVNLFICIALPSGNQAVDWVATREYDKLR